MLSNYLKIAIRNLRRHKAYSLINVFGLGIGIACCLFIYLYVSDELSYDTFQPNADRVVRIVEDAHTASETLFQATSAPAMGPALFRDFPEVLSFTRMRRTDGTLQYEDRTFIEKNVVFADSSFFDVFGYTLLRGNAATALVAPLSIVFSESQARKYFGDEDPLGKHIPLESGNDLIVTGVMADLPENTHHYFDILLSFTTLEMGRNDPNDQWFSNYVYTYLLLSEGSSLAALEQKLPAFLERHIGDEQRDIGFSYTLHLQPLGEIYLKSNRNWEPGPTGNASVLYLFSWVAVLILLIAGVNYVNLATARSSIRAREVGLRKVVGAQRSQLAVQFLGESLLMSTLALVLALGLLALFAPTFNVLSGKAFALATLREGYTPFVILALLLLVGLGAGAYPAVALSHHRPMGVLKGRGRSSRQGVRLRKGLVVFQFAISVFLIIGTLVVSRQLTFMRTQSLGFQPEHQLVIDFDGEDEIEDQAEAIKQVFEALPSVLSATMSSGVPGTEFINNLLVEVEHEEGTVRQSNMDNYFVDFDFIEQFNLALVAGRGFDKNRATDATSAYIINEAAVKHFGWQSPTEALGKRMTRGQREGEIIGVMKDFNYRSLRHQIDPLYLTVIDDVMSFLTLNLQAGDVAQAVAQIEEKWKQVAPDVPFNYFFLDARFDEQYRDEMRFGTLFDYFAVLAIFIACLGLYGLASFTVQQRTKEMGIRKVLGATIPQILALMYKEYALLLMLAILAGAPLAYFFMESWLADFAYRIPVHGWIIVLAASLVIVIAAATVGSQALKAATINPAESLRYE